MNSRLLGFGIFGIVLGGQLAAPQVSLCADLETIRDRGYLVVGIKDNWRPLGFVDETGELVGYEIDIARQLAVDLLGDAEAIQFQPVANNARLTAVLTDEVDMAIAGVGVTPMRQRVVSFSIPYYLDGTGFVTRLPTIQRLEDLRQGAIALLQGSEAVTHVNFFLPAARLIGVPSYPAALTTLEARQADAFAGDVSVLAGWVQEYPEYRLLPDVLTAVPLAIVMPKGVQYDTLRRQVNASLNQWHETGWLEERAAVWGLP